MCMCVSPAPKAELGGTIYNQDLQPGDTQVDDFVAEYKDLPDQVQLVCDKYGEQVKDFARTQLNIDLEMVRAFVQRYSAELAGHLKPHKDEGADWSSSLHIKSSDCKGGDLHILEHGADNKATTVCLMYDDCEYADPRILVLHVACLLPGTLGIRAGRVVQGR